MLKHAQLNLSDVSSNVNASVWTCTALLLVNLALAGLQKAESESHFLYLCHLGFATAPPFEETRGGPESDHDQFFYHTVTKVLDLHIFQKC